MTRRTLLFLRSLIFLAVAVSSLSAQTPTSDDPLSARSVVAVHADKAPELDGTLKDAAWQDARLISSFHQSEPFERQPATEKTEVRVLYVNRFLHFGILCFDADSKTHFPTDFHTSAH